MSHGEFNLCEVVAGVPGAGKSSYVFARLEQLKRERPRMVRIVHDAARWFVKKGALEHRDEASLFAAVRRPELADRIHAMVVGDTMRVFEAAEKVSREARGRGIVTVVYFDEASALRRMSPSYIDEWVNERIMLRRHELVGYIFGTQRVQMLHPSIFDAGTALVVLRCNARQVPALVERNCPPRVALAATRLEPCQFIRVPLEPASR